MNIQTFLFGPYPHQFELFDTLVMFDVLGALLLGLILWLILFFKKVHPIRQKLMNKFKNLGFVYGLLGLVWLAFRYEGARYLEWRFWISLIILFALAWLIKILMYWGGGYRREMAEHRQRQMKEKYLKS